MTAIVQRAKTAAKSVLGLLIRHGPVTMTAAMLSRALRDMRPDGSTIPARPAMGRDERPLTILALSPENFRGDLEALAASPGVRVIVIPEVWLYRLLMSFYPSGDGTPRYISVFNPPPDDPARPAKQRYRSFLRRALPKLYRRFGIDCVIGYHLHHVPDGDWGAVSQDLGFPYVIFQRECLFASEHVSRYTIERMSRLGRFEGAHVAVHNEVSVRTFEASGFIERERMSILGAIRMDDYTRRIDSGGDLAQKRPLATLFAFAVSSVYSEEMQDFFADVHLSFVQLAKEHPEIDFVIKYKNNVGPLWRQDFAAACDRSGLDPTSLPNLTITGTAEPQDLILRSAVVAGFNSTTLLAAGIAGKQVIVPRFGLMAQPDMRVYLYFPDDWYAFSVSESLDAFRNDVIDAIRNPQTVPEDVMSHRQAMFEEYVSSLDGNATRKHLLLLRDLVSADRAAQPAGWVRPVDYARERP